MTSILKKSTDTGFVGWCPLKDYSQTFVRKTLFDRLLIG